MGVTWGGGRVVMCMGSYAKWESKGGEREKQMHYLLCFAEMGIKCHT